MVRVTLPNNLLTALLCGSLLNAFATDPSNDDKIITGALDVESISAMVADQGKSETFNLTLTLPDLSDSNKSMKKVSFDCEGGGSPAHLNIVRCSGTKAKNDAKPPLRAHIAIRGQYVKGVIENPWKRYEISTNIERNGRGEKSGVSYSYAAANAEDVAYEHIGIEPERTETEVVDPPGRTLRKVSSVVAEDRMTPIDTKVLPDRVEHVDSATNSRKLDDGSEIDLMLYFTKRGACQWIGVSYNECTLDDDAMDLLQFYGDEWTEYFNNEVVSNSALDSDLTFVNVHVAVDPDYDEGTSSSTGTVFYDLTYENDGKLDNAHELRNEYSADFVVGFMYVQSGSAGIGWVPSTFPDPADAFSMTGGSYPFLSLTAIHEVGHNLGMNHARSQYSNPSPTDYSYGYTDCRPSQCWVTTMAYTSVCSGQCAPVGWIPVFSNPDVTYSGVPTGTVLDDNARQLSEVMRGAAINRYRGLSTIAPPSGGSYYPSEKSFFFDVVAKEDITITFTDIHFTSDSSAQVELGTSDAESYVGNELNDGFWTVIANEVLTPLSAINPDKLAKVAKFSNPLSISVSAGSKISIRIMMRSGDGFRVKAASGSLGDIAFENNDLSVTVGKSGTLTYVFSSAKTLYGGLHYSKGTQAPTDSPTAASSVEPTGTPTDLPTSEPTSSPTVSCSDSPLDLAFNPGQLKIPCDKLGSFPNPDCLCDDEGVSSHCPDTCGSCSSYACEDSTADFYTPQGQVGNCGLLSSFQQGVIDTYCELPIVIDTCRATCEVCAA